MGPTEHSVVALVELTDAEDLIDRHGAASFGDIQEVFYSRMENWVRPKDEWRRLDNHRFSVVLRGVSTRGELELATAKLARLFQEPHYQFGRPVSLEIVAGFAEIDKAENNIEQALRQAGTALRQARRSSQLYDIYTPTSENCLEEERKLVKRLEMAIELGELELYYQPKVHAGYHSLVGAEALMRWRPANGDIITPDNFIPVAERNDVIRPMTWWAVKSAVARLARWPDELSIAVNISPTLLLDGQLHSVVRDALEIHGVEPSRLVLEVTERVMVDNQQVMLRELARLWRLGIKVSLDDFGTGFSSLSYFRDLPVDEIKIDQGFVLRMLKSGKDHAIVKAVIDLAHNFSLQVVAEGVETLEIANRLSELKCDVLQGYVFDRPLTVEAFEAGYGISRTSGVSGKPDPTQNKLLI